MKPLEITRIVTMKMNIRNLHIEGERIMARETKTRVRATMARKKMVMITKMETTTTSLIAHLWIVMAIGMPEGGKGAILDY